MRESLRLHPPLNAISRRVMFDWHYKDYVVEKGCNVMVCPHISHKLPEYFPDPLRFNPKRPTPSHQFAEIPFGGGRHKCIGNAFAILQVKAILSTLLHAFDFELAQPPEHLCRHRPVPGSRRMRRGGARAVPGHRSGPDLRHG